MRSTIQGEKVNERRRKKPYINLEDLLDAGTSSLNNSLDVVAASLGHLGDTAGDELGLGVEGDLTRDEDLAVGFDGLGLLV